MQVGDRGRDTAAQGRLDGGRRRTGRVVVAVEHRTERDAVGCGRAAAATGAAAAALGLERPGLAAGAARGLGGGARIAGTDGFADVGQLSHADSSSSASGIT